MYSSVRCSLFYLYFLNFLQRTSITVLIKESNEKNFWLYSEDKLCVWRKQGKPLPGKTESCQCWKLVDRPSVLPLGDSSSVALPFSKGTNQVLHCKQQSPLGPVSAEREFIKGYWDFHFWEGRVGVLLPIPPTKYN